MNVKKIAEASLLSIVAVLLSTVRPAPANAATVYKSAQQLCSYLNSTQADTASLNGNTIKLQKDIKITNGFVLSEGTVVLDLEGHTIHMFYDDTNKYTNLFQVENGADLTICDDGIITGNATGGLIMVGNASLHLSVDKTSAHGDGAVSITNTKSDGSGISVYDSQNSGQTPVLDIEKADITADNRALSINDGKTHISGGTFTGGSTAIDFTAKQTSYIPTITVDGGTFTAEDRYCFIISGTFYGQSVQNNCTAKVIVNGGSFKSQAANCSVFNVYGGAELSLTGKGTTTLTCDDSANEVLALNCSFNAANIRLKSLNLQNIKGTFSNVSIQNNSSSVTPVSIKQGSNVIFNNVSVTTNVSIPVCITDSTLTANGGSFTSTTEVPSSTNCAILADNSDVTLKNCTLSDISGVRARNSSSLHVSGAVIQSTYTPLQQAPTCDIGTGIYVESGSSLSMDAGTITANYGIQCYDSSLTLTGGTIYAAYPVRLSLNDAESRNYILNTGSNDLELTSIIDDYTKRIDILDFSSDSAGFLQISSALVDEYVDPDLAKEYFQSIPGKGTCVGVNTDLATYEGAIVTSSTNYSVTYKNIDGAEYTDTLPSTVNSLAVYTLPSPQKRGYIFNGWYTDAKLTKKIDKIKYPTSNLVLYAKFIQINYAAPVLSCKSSGTKVTLTWNAISGVDGYNIYRQSGTGISTKIAATKGTSYSDTVSYGTQYTYMVMPYIGTASGTASNNVSVTLTKPGTGSSSSSSSSETTKKVTVKAVSFKLVKNVKTRSLSLKWSKNSKASGYQIQYGLKSNFKDAKTITIKKARTTSKKIKKLKKGKKYYVRIRAYKTVSGKKYYSKWSKKKSVKIKR